MLNSDVLYCEYSHFFSNRGGLQCKTCLKSMDFKLNRTKGLKWVSLSYSGWVLAIRWKKYIEKWNTHCRVFQYQLNLIRIPEDEEKKLED